MTTKQNEQPVSAALQADEDLSARSATAPRVSVDDLRNGVREVWYVNAGDAVEMCANGGKGVPVGHPIQLMTLCFLVCDNGFVIVGKSAPASAENFDEEKGRVFAYEDGMRQLWPMRGFALRQRLHDAAQRSASAETDEEECR